MDQIKINIANVCKLNNYRSTLQDFIEIHGFNPSLVILAALATVNDFTEKNLFEKIREISIERINGDDDDKFNKRYSELIGMQSEIKEKGKCIRCKSKMANVLYLPCGHVSICIACKPMMQTHCNLCNAKINEFTVVYL